MSILCHDPALLFSQAMESKLLVGGKNIVDHTNEQQKILEQKRQEIAEQVGSSYECGHHSIQPFIQLINFLL